MNEIDDYKELLQKITTMQKVSFKNAYFIPPLTNDMEKNKKILSKLE
jgi:hypothetical protein